MNVKFNFKVTSPDQEFLLGIHLVDGIAEEIESGNITNIKILSIGLFFFQIDIFW